MLKAKSKVFNVASWRPVCDIRDAIDLIICPVFFFDHNDRTPFIELLQFGIVRIVFDKIVDQYISVRESIFFMKL